MCQRQFSSAFRGFVWWCWERSREIGWNWLLKGKFPQTTMWIGWVESNFTNPTVKFEQIWIIHLKRRSHYSDNQSPTNDNRRPSTTNYRPNFRSKIGRRPVADQSPTNCQSLGDRTPTEFRIIIKIWKPIGDWLSQNQRLVGNHSAIDCQAHKRSFDVIHKFVTSFVFLMHRKDFGAKIWTFFWKEIVITEWLKRVITLPNSVQ